MLKMAHFLRFLLMTAKNQLQFGQSILFERSHFSKSFGKCYGFLDSELP